MSGAMLHCQCPSTDHRMTKTPSSVTAILNVDSIIIMFGPGPSKDARTLGVDAPKPDQTC
jgi:hypothetical protein